jgi:raffinose/stachyose/melibiose transport system substrate-binding protein
MKRLPRVSLFFTAAVIAVLASAACQKSDGGGQAASKGRTITWASLASPLPDENDYGFKYFQNPIQQAFPNDTINFVEYTDRQSLQIQIAGGGGPDIVDLDGPTDAIEFAKAGRVEDLGPYADKYRWEDLFFDWAYRSGFFEGKLYSVPNSFEGMVIYYNMEVFRKHNLNIPSTADELVEVCGQLQKAGVIPVSFGNSNYQGAVDWLYSSFTSCYAGPAAVKNALTGAGAWDDPLIVGAIQQMTDWWQAGYIGDKKSQAITDADMVALFAAGQAAMMINGTWATGDMMRTYKDTDWVIDLIPELRPGAGRVLPIATGGVHAINSNSKEKDFAAEIINYLFTSTDRHVESVRIANWQPYPIKAFTKESFIGMDPRMVDMYNDLMDAQAGGSTGYCSWTFYPSDVRVYMNENTDALFLGRLSVKDYLAQVQTLTDAAINAGTVPVIP